MPDLDTYPRVDVRGICVHGRYLHSLCQIADELLRFSRTVKRKRVRDRNIRLRPLLADQPSPRT